MVYLKFIGVWFLYFMQMNFNSASLEDKIVRRLFGGRKARRGHLPFVGKLFMDDYRLDGIYFECTVTILNNETIITAAHCFCNLVNKTLNTLNPSFYYVTFGSMNKSDKEIAKSYLKDIIIHDSYATAKNICQPEAINSEILDVALAKLKTPIQFNEYVRPIQLSKLGYYRGTAIIHAGYGNNSKQAIGTLRLGASYIEYEQDNIYISQALDDTESNGAFGDSGGPMLVSKNDETLLGGVLCSGGKYHTVYVSSNKFYPWVEKYGIEYNPPTGITPDRLSFTALCAFAVRREHELTK